MGDTASRFVREQSTDNVTDYRRRVYRLAALYVGIMLCAGAANVLIILRGRLFVTLAQRSNVETLTLAVVLLLFFYLIVVSYPGFIGALKIVWHNLPAWLGGDRAAVERRKQACLTRRTDRADPADPVYLDKVVRRQGARGPDDPIVIPIGDAAGSLGEVTIRGAEMIHGHGACRSSNSLYAYFEQRIAALAGQPVQIVRWAGIDDEAAAVYAGVVAFSANLARRLPGGGDDASPLWPAVELSDEALETLERECSELCPALRDESHLPDMEYSVEHRLPIIPEPLAFISLSRQEQRADPATSMGCAFLVTLVLLAVVVGFLLFPPWVPGK